MHILKCPFLNFQDIIYLNKYYTLGLQVYLLSFDKFYNFFC